MRIKHRLPFAALRATPLLALLALLACDKSQTPAESLNGSGSGGDSSQEAATVLENSVASSPFDKAQVFLEFNTTDDDMGFQVFLDAEGWRNVSLTDPRGNRIGRIVAEGPLGQIGITELRFESAEPSPEDVLSRFRAGEYKFRGETVEGASLASNVRLSHTLLDAPTFSPRNGQVVDPRNTVVRWNAPGAGRVEIILEHDELGHVFDVTLSATTRRLTIPPEFLRRGTEYKIELLAIAGNGNRTIAESTIRTAP
jgi:hypothetical protein